jgi:hypothetical protein
MCGIESNRPYELYYVPKKNDIWPKMGPYICARGATHGTLSGASVTGYLYLTGTVLV